MAILDTLRSVDHLGNGVATSFPFTFRIFQTSDLVVSLISPAAVETVLDLGVGYSVTLTGRVGGTVNILTGAPAGGWTVRIKRLLPLTQPADLRNMGRYNAETVEDALDRLVMIAQQIAGGEVSLTVPEDFGGKRIYNFRGSAIIHPSSTLTLDQTSHGGRVIECTHAAGCAVTCPASLPEGFTSTIIQAGAGAVVFSAGSGATLRTRLARDRTAGQWAVAQVLCPETGTIVLCGDVIYL